MLNTGRVGFFASLAGFALASLTRAAYAGEVQVDQKDLQFSPGAVTINVGDSVRFTNERDSRKETNGYDSHHHGETDQSFTKCVRIIFSFLGSVSYWIRHVLSQSHIIVFVQFAPR